MGGKGRCMDNIFVERLWPVDMWTIGVADRLCFPRFPSQLGKHGNARLRPHPHRHHDQQWI